MPDDVYNDDGFESQLSQMSATEILAFNNFKAVYQQEHQLPRKRKLGLNWEFSTTLVASASAVILAAFRTGHAFYLSAAYNGSQVFSLAEAIVAVLAIEGTIVLFSVREAHLRRITNVRMSGIGLAIAFSISVLAGLFQSVNIIPNVPSIVLDLLNWSLVISMGVGATVIASLGGVILGSQVVILENSMKEENERFANSARSYRGRMIAAWKNSAELLAVNELKGTNYKRTTTANELENEPVRTNVHRTRTQRTVRSRSSERTNGTDRKDLIYRILNQVFDAENRVAGTSEVAEILARMDTDNPDENPNTVSRLKANYKGYVHKVRNEWVSQRQGA